MDFLRILFALLHVFSAIWGVVGRMLMFSWPVTFGLAAILISEFPHAPKKWECRFCSALLPMAIQVGMVAWAVASLFMPIFRFTMIGPNLGMVALALQILIAGYAWKRCEGYRCFFLALMLNELWIGYWSCLIAGAIISRPNW